MIRKSLIATCAFLTLVIIALTSGMPHVSAEDQPTLEPFYEVDGVYSTYAPSTNYTVGGGMYTSRGGIAVRAINTERVEAGLTMEVDTQVTVTAQSALVVQIMIHSNLTRTMKLDIVEEDATVENMKNTFPAYKAKDGNVTSTLEIGNNAFNNNLASSTGHHANDTDAAYNELVVPLTSYGYTVGETVSIADINFYVPAWSTGQYHKYLVSAIGLSDTFSTEAPFDYDVIWDAATDAYQTYGAAEPNFDIRYLEPGQIWMEPSVNSSGTGIFQELVFKFPDALINESGMVETSNLKGLTLEFENGTATAFNGHFKLYNNALEWVANSNYSNLKTQKVTKDGTVASSNAKYFYPNTNTVGYSDAFILYNFNSTSNVTSESTESFYCASGALPAEISPYFTFTYDNNQTMSLDSVNFGTIRILTDDITIHDVSSTSDEQVDISAVKGYLGNRTTFKAYDGGRNVEQVTLNGTPLSETDINALFSESGLTVTITGDMVLDITFEAQAAFVVTFYDDDGITVLSEQTIEPGGSAVPPEDPTKPATAQYTYVFSGWQGDYTDVNGNVDIFATYDQTVNTYTVTFLDDDGVTVLGTSTVDYGQPAQAPADPTKPSTAEHDFTFDGWDTDFSTVTGNMDVLATYAQSTRQYTVTFVDDDGETVLGTSMVDYGSGATAPSDPAPRQETYYTLTFDGWNASFDTVTEDVVVEATYVAVLTDDSNLILAGLDTIVKDSTWVDAGVAIEGDGITIDVTGEVDNTTSGTYELTYEVFYMGQTLGLYERFVHVTEPLPDVIITLEEDVTTVFQNSTYEDAGATSNIGTVEAEGTVDTAQPGVYVITYTVTVDDVVFTKTKYVTVLDIEGIVPVKAGIVAIVNRRKELMDI